jgi:hypothetical protein
MADETMQTGEDTSWWDLDIFADSELPSTSFDEPLEWPETLDWGDFPSADGDLQFPSTGDLESGPFFPPAPSAQEPSPEAPAPAAGAEAQSNGDDGDPTMAHVTVLSGLGGTGSVAPTARAAVPSTHQHLPDSIWSGDAGNGTGSVVTSTMASPALYAEQDGGGGGWKRRFDIRHGNAAIIALISFVSLILLGMFMSVRARNQLPDTSQTRTTSDQIQVQGTLNTVPLTTTVTTTPAAINIADLLPPAEDATTAGASGSSATTAAPARSTPAAGGTGTTQPAAQPTNTTAAPVTTAAPATTTPSVTSPPADQTTTPSTPRRTTPSFPSITSTVPDSDGPTVPSLPPGFPPIPGFNSN